MVPGSGVLRIALRPYGDSPPLGTAVFAHNNDVALGDTNAQDDESALVVEVPAGVVLVFVHESDRLSKPARFSLTATFAQGPTTK
jgi:hypothetical protein